MIERIYKFEDGFGEGIKVSGGHKLKLHLTFYAEWENPEVTQTIVKTTMLPPDDPDFIDMIVFNWGKREIGNAVDEKLLVYQNYSFSIYDGEDDIKNILIKKSTPKYWHSALVQLFKKKLINGVYEETYKEIYNGYLDQSNLDKCYNSVTKIFQFKAYPRTDLLKEFLLHDENGLALNPLNYQFDDFNDSSTQGHWMRVWRPKFLIDLITDIYKVVNENVTLEINCNTVWRGYIGIGELNAHNFSFADISLGIPLSFLYQGWTYKDNSFISRIFGDYNTFNDLNDLSDLLKKLGETFMFRTGMLTNEVAFIKELFSYDENNTQVLDTLLDEPIYGIIPSVDGVRYRSREYEINTSEKSNYKERPKINVQEDHEGIIGTYITPIEFSYPNQFAFKGAAEKIDEEILSWLCYYPAQGGKGTIFASYNNMLFRIHKAKKSNVDGEHYFGIHGEIQSRNMWQMRGWENKTGCVSLRVKGSDYSYLKNIDFDNVGWEIYKMSIDDFNDETQLDALAVENIDTTIELPDTPQPPNLKLGLISSGFYRIYVAAVEVTKEDANTGLITCLTIPAGCSLEMITGIIVDGFTGLTGFEIASGSKVFIPSNRYPFTRNNQSILSVIGQNFLEDTPIFMRTTGSCSQGGANIKFWVIKRED